MKSVKETVGDFLIDTAWLSTIVGECFNPRKFVGKPGKFLQMIMDSPAWKKWSDKIRNMTAKDLDHPWYAKKLVNMMKEDPFMDNASTDKEKEIVKKIRGNK